MKEIYTPGMPEVDWAALEAHVRTVAEQFPDARRVLIVPPDFTRCYSMAGEITKLLYGFFASRAEVKIIPALGPTCLGRPGAAALFRRHSRVLFPCPQMVCRYGPPGGDPRQRNGGDQQGKVL